MGAAAIMAKKMAVNCTRRLPGVVFVKKVHGK
ncbi:MAG: hypothetical protein A4E59_01369 [Syntrophorhabdus sp. PtaB.Bin027]|jgi:hypothetical protein|nr:MAG: hypothetical protein A4E59_01369 [Syntrophorhabdus sp. PtaB.Bin027]OQB78392.1 MAG: hypothetical protein BWX92_00007 [Deltaproteobacteria bacterium ADurb.Bin135]